MGPVEQSFRLAKAASKVHLARYAIDKFLLEVAAKLAPGALVVDGGAGNCKHKNFFPHVRYISFDFTPGRKRVYGEIDLSADLYQMPFRKDTFEAGWQEHGMPHDYFRFTSSGLRYLLEQADFEIISIKPMGDFSGIWDTVSRYPIVIFFLRNAG
jgi:hypothetical protein